MTSECQEGVIITFRILTSDLSLIVFSFHLLNPELQTLPEMHVRPQSITKPGISPGEHMSFSPFDYLNLGKLWVILYKWKIMPCSEHCANKNFGISYYAAC
jgi:hypothetical protein